MSCTLRTANRWRPLSARCCFTTTPHGFHTETQIARKVSAFEGALKRERQKTIVLTSPKYSFTNPKSPRWREKTCGKRENSQENAGISTLYILEIFAPNVVTSLILSASSRGRTQFLINKKWRAFYSVGGYRTKFQEISLSQCRQGTKNTLSNARRRMPISARNFKVKLSPEFFLLYQ